MTPRASRSTVICIPRARTSRELWKCLWTAPRDDDAIGAGDQGVVIGYACNETPELMPMPVVIAHRLTSLLTLARMTEAVHGIGPDGKSHGGRRV